MLCYLGLYQTCVEVEGLHDEESWPQGIGIVQMEERRQLFWSMYTLDVYTAFVWHTVIRSCESQSNVAYPTPVGDDTQFSDARYASFDGTSVLAHASPATAREAVTGQSWLQGWNFTTDLYRVLEHIVDQFRRRRDHRLSTHVDTIFGGYTASNSDVLAAILNMYQGLPSRFKEIPKAHNSTDHLLNFQTASIAATIQLVRIMVIAAEDATVKHRCTVANELL